MEEVDVEQRQRGQHDQAGNTEVYQQDVSGVSESAISKYSRLSDCQTSLQMLIIDGVKKNTYMLYVMLIF